MTTISLPANGKPLQMAFERRPGATLAPFGTREWLGAIEPCAPVRSKRAHPSLLQP
jgi:hypothetical protein